MSTRLDTGSGSELELFDLNVPNNQDNFEATGSTRTQKFRNFISAVANPGKVIFESAEGRDRELSSTELKYREAAIALFNTSIASYIIGIGVLVTGLTLSCSIPIIVIAGILLVSALIAEGAAFVYNIKADNANENANFEFCRDTKLPELRKKIKQKEEEFQKDPNKFQAQINEANENLSAIQALLNNANTNNTAQLDSYLKALSRNEAFCYTIEQMLLHSEDVYSQNQDKPQFMRGIRILDAMCSEKQNIINAVVRSFILGEEHKNQAQELAGKTFDIQLPKINAVDIDELRNKMDEILEGLTK